MVIDGIAWYGIWHGTVRSMSTTSVNNDKFLWWMYNLWLYYSGIICENLLKFQWIAFDTHRFSFELSGKILVGKSFIVNEIIIYVVPHSNEQTTNHRQNSFSTHWNWFILVKFILLLSVLSISLFRLCIETFSIFATYTWRK